MNLHDILKISNGEIINGNILDQKIGNIQIDSRKVEINDIFICIKGKNDDGHNYIKEIENKCSCIIVSKDVIVTSDVLVIKVDDTISFMGTLSNYIRLKYINIPLIAITGSVGKTTTKELLYHVLNEKYKILYTKKNYNNNIGVPMTIFNLNENYNLIILEMGMNHLNEISNLSKMVLPNTCIITNIGTSHIGYLKSQKNILKAKLEITDGLNDGILLLNNKDKYLKKIKKNKNNIVCNINEFKVYNVITTYEHLFFSIIYKNKNYNIKFNIPNSSLINNILLVIKTSLIYGMSIEDIIERISTFEQISGRNNILLLKDNIILVDDCYNSSYESLISSLNMIKNFKDKKLIILGDILELGSYSKKIHLKIGRFLKKYKIKNNISVITVGTNMKLINKYVNCSSFNTSEEVITFLSDLNITDCCILLKGSRGMHLEKIKDVLIIKNAS